MTEKRLLGIIASHRRIGNAEIVVKAVSAKMQGYNLSMIRLAGLDIRPCKGCYACLLPGVRCNLDDDMEWLLERMAEADAIIFAVPNYVLGPAGIMKMAADRALQTAPYQERLMEKKTAVALTLGREDYRGYADTALVAQVSALGLEVSCLDIFYGTHPGEVALSDDFEEKTARMARALLPGGAAPVQPDRCPRCRSDLFRVRDDGLECALCKSRARITGNGLDFYYFHPEFGDEGKKGHLKWLLGKKEEYGRIKEKLAAVRRAYDHGAWLSPPEKVKRES
jgi:multimeric flavodoxin WrbA